MRFAAIFATGLVFSATGLAAELGYGVELMSYWRHDLNEDESDENEFAIQAVILDLKGTFENVGGRLALEVADAFTDPHSYLRYAYASVTELVPTLGRDLELQMGLIPTSYIDWADSRAWPFIFISSGLAELEGAEFPCDLGVAVNANLGEVFEGFSARMAVTNGEGWTTLEDDAYKAYSLAVEFEPRSGPAKGLSVMAYGRTGYDDSSDWVQNRVGVGAAYESGHVFGVSGQYVYCEDGDAGDPFTVSGGWSAALWLSLLENRQLMVLVRYDAFDPDTDSASIDDDRSLFIVGLGGEIGAFSWCIDYQTVEDEADPANEDISIYVHTFVRF